MSSESSFPDVPLAIERNKKNAEEARFNLRRGFVQTNLILTND